MSMGIRANNIFIFTSQLAQLESKGIAIARQLDARMENKRAPQLKACKKKRGK